MKRKLSLWGGLSFLSLEVFAECKEGMPCIGGPSGLIQDNEKASLAVNTVNWGFGAVALGVGAALAIYAAVKFKDQQYAQGLASGGGVIFMIIMFALIKSNLGG